jgi:hypothetical protein
MEALFVTSVKPMSPQRIKITTKDGTITMIDLSDLIARREIYWRLRQDRYFKMVKVDEQGVLRWPEGEDLAPESIGRYLAAERTQET